MWPTALIFLAVVSGIYVGVFTPTGDAAREAVIATAASTAMIFFIVLGAGFFNGFLALARMPQTFPAFVVEQGYGPWLVLPIILLVYLVLGCVMDSLSMILLTVPTFYLVITMLDFGLTTEEMAIWIGILVLIIVEVGLITPPVGLNVFIIDAVDPETPIGQIYRAVTWFVVSDILRVILLAAFPAISLFLIV